MSFSSRLIRWQRKHGRHDLPWQGQDAYRVWLSEIMLQQTQVATVIPYYQRFVASFPTVAALAAATEDEVLAHWSGLGYYARGRNLHKAARIVVEKFNGEFPRKLEDLLELPGIGRSTAAAICALAYHERRAILDGNVKRVLARWCGIEGWAGNKKVEEQLWQQAESLLPREKNAVIPAQAGIQSIDQTGLPLSRERRPEDSSSASNIATYTQSLMDIGATVCTRGKPKCSECPVNADCVALNSNRIAELPAPRPKKAVPERHATFLLLMHGSDILLEKRPGSGIWGGLWCPPQIDDGQGVAEDYLQRNDIAVSERIDLPEFAHTFTHFKLHITPVLLRVARKPMRVQQPGSLWIDVGEALRGAIPTPVRSLLNGLVG
ncbi:MAG: A/G-specific adenine glycosylase [Gallionella sp.]|nr:A/G-specific adenine glycosylase [Gallionella sp.]MCK9354232.1 A/G-specific adenine glycosylase [Gallionella sp.]